MKENETQIDVFIYTKHSGASKTWRRSTVYRKVDYYFLISRSPEALKAFMSKMTFPTCIRLKEKREIVYSGGFSFLNAQGNLIAFRRTFESVNLKYRRENGMFWMREAYLVKLLHNRRTKTEKWHSIENIIRDLSLNSMNFTDSYFKLERRKGKINEKWLKNHWSTCSYVTCGKK